MAARDNLGVETPCRGCYVRRKSFDDFLPFFEFAKNSRYLVKTFTSINAAVETPMPYITIWSGSKAAPSTSMPKY